MKILRCLITCVFLLAIFPVPSILAAAEQPEGQSDLAGDGNVESPEGDDPNEAASLDRQVKNGMGESPDLLQIPFTISVIVGLGLLLFILIRPLSVSHASPAPLVQAVPAENTSVQATEEKTVTPDVVEPPPDMSDRVAIELALQTWRLEKRINQLPLADHPKLLRRMEDSIKKLTQLLTDNQVVIDDPLHRKYVEGWVEVEAVAAETVTADEYPTGLDEGPFVHETRRPIVRRNNRPIAKGEVVIAEKQRKN